MMYINADDIIEWRKTIMRAADDIASLRGNVSDEMITRLANTIKDMGFPVSYAASQLRAECDDMVADESAIIKEQITRRLEKEDDRVKKIKEKKEFERWCDKNS